MFSASGCAIDNKAIDNKGVRASSRCRRAIPATLASISAMKAAVSSGPASSGSPSEGTRRRLVADGALCLVTPLFGATRNCLKYLFTFNYTTIESISQLIG